MIAKQIKKKKKNSKQNSFKVQLNTILYLQSKNVIRAHTSYG